MILKMGVEGGGVGWGRGMVAIVQKGRGRKKTGKLSRDDSRLGGGGEGGGGGGKRRGGGGGMDLESLRPYKDRQHKAINRRSLSGCLSLSLKKYFTTP